MMLVLVVLGIATYAAVRLTKRGGTNPPPRGPLAGTRQRRPTGPLGPDDDEEFLRELDRKRRRDDGAGGPGGPGGSSG